MDIASDARPALGAGPREEDDGGSEVLRLPSLRAIVRHALPALLESTIVPGALFYLVLLLDGFHGALIAALSWSFLALGRRLVGGHKVPAVLVLSVVLVSARTVVAYATGSAFLYFVQPTASTFLVAVLFLVTAVARRPIIEKLARDFCPLDPEMFARPFVRRFFLRLSLLWFVVLATQAGFVMWLLLESSVRTFVVERSLVSAVLTVGGIVLSTLWFVRVMRGAGLTVRFSGALASMSLGTTAPTVAATASDRESFAP
ncbi:MAG TPA: VC0807 family protein [Acidimicrobiales bacterium]